MKRHNRLILRERQNYLSLELPVMLSGTWLRIRRFQVRILAWSIFFFFFVRNFYLICTSEAMFTWQPGCDLSCVYKRWIRIKREQFNKPFSYNPYNFRRNDPAKCTMSLFNPVWNLNPASRPGLRLNPGWDFNLGCHVKAWLLLYAYQVETCHVNIAWGIMSFWRAQPWCHLFFSLFPPPPPLSFNFPSVEASDVSLGWRGCLPSLKRRFN